jgi:hypothetical protein
VLTSAATVLEPSCRLSPTVLAQTPTLTGRPSPRS